MRKLHKATFGLLLSSLILIGSEVVLRMYCSILDRDFRVPPLPEHPNDTVLCAEGQQTKLCPDRGPSYERVRPEVFLEKPVQRRIIAIGESFVYGLGIEADQAWPKQLQNQTGIETLNFGRCGTYARRLIPILKAAITLEPDLILLSTGNNEHTMTSFFKGPLGRNPLRSYRILRMT